MSLGLRGGGVLNVLRSWRLNRHGRARGARRRLRRRHWVLRRLPGSCAPQPQSVSHQGIVDGNVYGHPHSMQQQQQYHNPNDPSTLFGVAGPSSLLDVPPYNHHGMYSSASSSGSASPGPDVVVNSMHTPSQPRILLPIRGE